MHKLSRSLLLYSLLVSMLLAGCSHTSDVTAVWKDPAYQGRPQKILLYAILQDSMVRQFVEDEFAGQLKRRKVNAVPAYEVLPGEGPITVEVLRETIKSQGFDALMITRVTGTGETTVHVPGSATYPAPGPSGFSGYLAHPAHDTTSSMAGYSQGYSYADPYLVTETRLFDAATERLIWTASAETRLVQEDAKVVKDYVNRIVNNLRRDKVVP